MMCRGQFQVAIGDSVPKLFRFGTAEKLWAVSTSDLPARKPARQKRRSFKTQRLAGAGSGNRTPTGL